ncbi:MAG: ExbD/TolR family protein [Pirellulaceae bacterium]
MELLAQGARFFEPLGYALAVLAVGILFAGVIWSLRLLVSEKRRTFFLVASLAALTLFCGGGFLLLVLTQPLTPGTQRGQRFERTDRRSVGEDDIDGGVYTTEIHVRPDGTVILEGKAMALEGLVPHLRGKDRNKRLHVTIRADAAASIGVVQPVMHHLTQHGVVFTVQVSH